MKTGRPTSREMVDRAIRQCPGKTFCAPELNVDNLSVIEVSKYLRNSSLVRKVGKKQFRNTGYMRHTFVLYEKVDFTRTPSDGA